MVGRRSRYRYRRGAPADEPAAEALAARVGDGDKAQHRRFGDWSAGLVCVVRARERLSTDEATPEERLKALFGSDQIVP